MQGAFHASIHNLNVDGVSHIANMSDPQIPAALAPAVSGVVSMDDFNRQQGMFLFSGAERTTFEESLELMMTGADSGWYRRFRVPEAALNEIEQELFQLNVHDLSLFPDTEGLAGFVRQKLRLRR